MKPILDSGWIERKRTTDKQPRGNRAARGRIIRIARHKEDPEDTHKQPFPPDSIRVIEGQRVC
jgi:hypothetical protein